MRTIVITVYLNLLFTGVFAQQPVKYFELSDSAFSEGSIYKLDIYYALMRPGVRIAPECYAQLDQVVQLLKTHPEFIVEISAHTDFRPIPITNDSLSFKRASDLRDYFNEKGIEPDRVIPKGYGKNIPYTVQKSDLIKYTYLNDGDILTEEFIKNLPTIEQQEGAHQLNRRTELKILSIE
ncbi:MAG: hypothetical protein A2W91_10005 [Bacteroidetes bacterium GWF2_38_335]|nr:MAG: hypothetical protein A2W91_10005 [Bacteroidetes bacterium GWF2_38_335]HBS88041.1 hypothetical protein [Bacteroidales bacterium]